MVEIEGYVLPEELFYTKDHTWARIEDDETVTVGIDDFAVKAAGEIEYIDLPMEDEEFEIGEAFGSMESAKWVGGLIMPVSGTVIEVNEEIENNLSILSEDPYGKGWLIRVEPSNLNEDVKELIHGDEVEEWLKEEIKSRKE